MKHRHGNDAYGDGQYQSVNVPFTGYGIGKAYYGQHPENNEYIGIRRLEGTLGAVEGFAKKVGAGLGSGLLGILIGMAGYDGNLAVQPASAITMVRLLYSLIPAAMYVIVYLVCRLYKLDKMMPEIKAVNEKSRAEAAAALAESAAQ